MIHMQDHRLTGAIFVLPGLPAGHAAGIVMPQHVVTQFAPFTRFIKIQPEGETDQAGVKGAVVPGLEAVKHFNPNLLKFSNINTKFKVFNA